MIQEKLGDKTPNLTSDWNDGILVAKLVDSIAPGLCPECDTMEPQNALENATHAMRMADEWLGIPQVIKIHITVVCVLTFINKADTANQSKQMFCPSISKGTHFFKSLESPITNLAFFFSLCNTVAPT